MLRKTLLKVLAPAVLAIGGVPALASAHSHAFVQFGFGCGPYYQPAYCAPAYVAPAPAVVYAAPAVAYAAPVVVAPPVVYSAPAVVVVTPAPAPAVVYSSGWCYPHRVFYDHVRWYRR